MSSGRVLVVDDDEDIRQLVALKLSGSGLDVVCAKDGAGALEAAFSRSFDVIVLDVMMPGMSGIEVLRSLRTAEPPVDTAVLLLTARNQKYDVDAGFAAGADDYVSKPFSPRELQSRVDVLIGRS